VAQAVGSTPVTFIVFEGMDGAGKTKVSSEVATRLSLQGAKVTYINKKNHSFDDRYVGAHMRTIRQLIWEYDQDAPLYKLGDEHWLHLMRSWFSTLDHAVIKPSMADEDNLIIVDSWIYKFIARFMAKSGDAGAKALGVFSGLTRPDLVIYLSVEPEIAARRKTHFTMAECGNMDDLIGANKDNFIVYQTRIRCAFSLLAQDGNWHKIDTSHKSIEDVAQAAALAVADQLRGV
jgi:dTMP kinase